MQDIFIKKTAALAFCVAVCFGAAVVGSLFTYPHVDSWYASLQKPSWTPPNWLFGPVWSLLYLLMALAAWHLWLTCGLRSAAGPLALFALQLVLNMAWSALFFAMRSPGIALVEIVFLWLAILLTVIAFWKRTALSGVLLAPYLAWVSFAVILNLAIWKLN